MALVDASPSRERLGRVVELLRGVEEDATARRIPPRRPRRAVVRPPAASRVRHPAPSTVEADPDGR